jgi:hypothetical protein
LLFLDAGVDLLEFQLDAIQVLARLGDIADAELLGFPLLFEAGELALLLDDFGIEFLTALDRMLVGLFGKLARGECRLQKFAGIAL